MQLTMHWAAQLDDYVIDLAWSPVGRQLADAPVNAYTLATTAIPEPSAFAAFAVLAVLGLDANSRRKHRSDLRA